MTDALARKAEPIVDQSTDGAKPRLARAFNKEEAAYMQGGAEPVTSSVLISNSKFLNSPLFREAFMQASLRRYGYDLPPTYTIPHMARGIADVLDVEDYNAQIAAEKLQNPDFAEWLDARQISRYGTGTLAKYAQGTLGAEIRAFVEDSGMKIEFTAVGEKIDNDFDYQLKRRSMNHDIEHMVTAFGPDPIGEVALAVCNNTCFARFFTPKLAHYLSLNTTFVTAAAYMRDSLHYPAIMPYIHDAFRLGVVMGQSIRKPLALVRWEDYLDWPLEAIRTDLGINPGPGGEWTALADLARG